MKSSSQAAQLAGGKINSLSGQGMIVSDKAVRLLASSIFRQLQDEGCRPKDIISVSSQLIDLVTNEIQKLTDSSSV